MPTTLRVSDLSVAFGARTLFSGLDLTLADGDVTAVVGPNGSGKSTLMRTIVGELPVEAGSIRLAPRDATVALAPAGRARPVRDAARLRPSPHRRHRRRHRARVRVCRHRRRLPGGSEDRYAAALERWLALGAADLDERLPEVAARVGLDVDRGPSARHASPAGRPPGPPRRRAAEPVRRAAARRADQRPRRPRARRSWPTSSGPRGADPHRQPRPHLPRRGRRRASSSSTSRSSASATTPAAGATYVAQRELARRARLGGLRGVCRRA